MKSDAAAVKVDLDIILCLDIIKFIFKRNFVELNRFINFKIISSIKIENPKTFLFINQLLYLNRNGKGPCWPVGRKCFQNQPKVRTKLSFLKNFYFINFFKIKFYNIFKYIIEYFQIRCCLMQIKSECLDFNYISWSQVLTGRSKISTRFHLYM